MGRIPAPALALGLAGLIPFLYGAAAAISPGLAMEAWPPRGVLEVYGVIILAFMAGCLWGFGAKAGADLWRWLSLSVIPAIALFFGVIVGDSDLLIVLVAGFPALLAFDFAFARAGVAPGWWMPLRILLTIVVTACLAIGAFA